MHTSHHSHKFNANFMKATHDFSVYAITSYTSTKHTNLSMLAQKNGIWLSLP